MFLTAVLQRGSFARCVLKTEAEISAESDKVIDFMYIKDMKWLEKALLMDSVYKNKKVVDCGLQVCYNIVRG